LDFLSKVCSRRLLRPKGIAQARVFWCSGLQGVEGIIQVLSKTCDGKENTRQNPSPTPLVQEIYWFLAREFRPTVPSGRHRFKGGFQ
jgi:hypothetical protein